MRTIVIGTTLACLLSACASMQGSGPNATATIAPASGSKTTGTVKFTQKGDKVLVTADISSLTPGAHGFHIHEKGDCSAPDAMSTGGHFNPGSKPHGHPLRGEHHVGDIPALEADAGGTARLSIELSGINMQTGADSIIGKGVIVHAAPDDYKTQPTGNAGGRVGCGVIVLRHG